MKYLLFLTFFVQAGIAEELSWPSKKDIIQVSACKVYKTIKTRDRNPLRILSMFSPYAPSSYGKYHNFVFTITYCRNGNKTVRKRVVDLGLFEDNDGHGRGKGAAKSKITERLKQRCMEQRAEFDLYSINTNLCE
jgi:hypothetical protein